jgi:hypothetical protein
MSTTPNEPEKAISDALQSAGERAAKAAESAESATPGSPTHAVDPKAAAAAAAATAAAAARQMAEGLGDGSTRYGEDAAEIPPSGSEESWSAGHPGLEIDQEHGISGKRFAAGALIGLAVLTFSVFAGYSLLTAKSPNGNGAAAWTAGVTKDGAIVQGISAQNDVGPHAAALGAVGQQVRDAAAACDAATGNSSQLTATTGTVAGIGDWAIKATPSVNEIKDEAAKLATAVTGDDSGGIATAAKDLCTSFGKITALPAMPDAVGSAAWAAGIIAYADAANNALKGASGDQSALVQAGKDLVKGNADLNALSARITGAT